MSDDLVKQARSFCIHTPLSKPMITKLADRIAALEAELRELRLSELAALGQAEEACEKQRELEAENAQQTRELKKLWIALSTYENKVQEYASGDWARSDHAHDWLKDDAGETARAALEEMNDD